MAANEKESILYVSAPGKVILHGEHAVVYGKTALAASLNLRTFLQLKTLVGENSVSINLPDIGLKRVWCLDELTKTFADCLQTDISLNPCPPSQKLLAKMREFANVVEHGTTRDLAVLASLYLYLSIFQQSNPAIHVDLRSELPTGAGLGSSAAFSVCLSAAFLTYARKITPLPAKESGTLSWNKEDLNLINLWAFEAERMIHGNPSGIDNAVSTYGGMLHYQGKAIRPLTDVPVLRILLTNTKIPRSTKILVAGVREKYKKYPSVICPVLDSIEGISEICQAVFKDLVIGQSLRKEYSLMAASDQSDSVLQNTDECPVDESALFSKLEDLIDMNQKFLEILGVSHPSLEKLCSLTLSYGLHSKLTGAGGGGCALTLLRPGTSTDTVALVKKAVAEVGYDSWETSIGGAGVTIHQDDPQS